MMLRQCLAAGLLLSASVHAHAQTSDATTAPASIQRPVQYPASAISGREEGTVWILAQIDATGHPTSARVEKSSGHPDLDAAALQSFSQWTFRPGTKDGKPNAGWLRVPVVFHLNYPQPNVPAPHGSLLGAYAAAIPADVGAHWQRPKNLVQQSCVVEIVQLPGGQVIQAQVQPACPYDDATKQSLVAATMDASPLPYKGYEAVFQRSIHLTFLPE